MAVKIYNKDGEYITTMGIMRKMEFNEEVELIKALHPEYADCVFKKITKRELQPIQEVNNEKND